jgi:hypothetical protein
MPGHEAMNDLERFAEALELKTLDLIYQKDWPALSALIAPECQFVTSQGVYDKAEAMDLMQNMQLTNYRVRGVKATSSGDNIVVSFELACSEFVDGQHQSAQYARRLSVWKASDNTYECIAYADFNREPG